MLALAILIPIYCNYFNDFEHHDIEEDYIDRSYYSIPFCNVRPFFQFGRCPKRHRVYTMFDNFYVQLHTINVRSDHRNNLSGVDCDNQDIQYLLSIMKHLKYGIIDESMARWFLRLFEHYILEKVDHGHEYEGDRNCFRRCFIQCPGNLCEWDFIEKITKDRCSRFLLWSFLKFLDKQVNNALRKCDFGYECKTDKRSCDRNKEQQSYCHEDRGRHGRRRGNRHYTNFKLYLHVIQVLILRLKKCIKERSKDPLAGMGLKNTLIVALNSKFVNEKTGNTSYNYLFYPSNIIIPDKTTKPGMVCSPFESNMTNTVNNTTNNENPATDIIAKILDRLFGGNTGEEGGTGPEENSQEGNEEEEVPKEEEEVSKEGPEVEDSAEILPDFENNGDIGNGSLIVEMPRRRKSWKTKEVRFS